ncbi:thrombospondin-1-like [Lytechinus pictus]|uniref:thrombospondin-1-like n=1 Tax=Lytechinus pictus TaxID=7653 RepID=UPI0030B9B122
MEKVRCCFSCFLLLTASLLPTIIAQSSSQSSYVEFNVLQDVGISAASPGVDLVRGEEENSVAYKIKPSKGDIAANTVEVQRLGEAMSDDGGFVLVAKVKMGQKARGTVVSIDNHAHTNRLFGLVIDRKGDKVVMPYSYTRDGVTSEDSLEFSGLNLVETEERDWHTFTLDVQGNFAILYADCTRIGIQIMYGSFVHDVTPDQYSLRLGKGLKGRKDVPDFKVSRPICNISLK